jgi:hypothetical protein
MIPVFPTRSWWTPLFLAVVAMAMPAFGQNQPGQPADPDKKATKEEKIAEYLQRLAETERGQKFEGMEAVISDIDRVCHLTEDQKKRLTLAAKGAVDKYLESWRTQMDGWVRQRTTHLDGEINDILAGMNSVRFGNAKNWAPERQEVWKSSVDSALTVEQRDAYRTDVKARADFKHQAMANVVVADLDRRIKLAPEQRTKLLALAVASSSKYWERLENWSGDEENLPFYQMGAIMGGVPKEEIDKLLTERQKEGWKQYFSRYSGIWETIQQMEDVPGAAAPAPAPGIPVF